MHHLSPPALVPHRTPARWHASVASFATLALLAMSLALVAFPSSAQTFQARVVGVIDGDTVDVLDAAKTQIRCRLGNIDAPERRQAFGNASRKHLSDLAFGRQVQVSVSDTDRYGRSICLIAVSGRDLSTTQVAAGMAWVYTAYNRDRSLPALEAEARRGGVGLWADRGATPPWEWRRHKAGRTGP